MKYSLFILSLGVSIFFIFGKYSDTVMYTEDKTISISNHDFIHCNSGGSSLDPSYVTVKNETLYIVNAQRNMLTSFSKKGEMLNQYTIKNNISNISSLTITNNKIIIGDNESNLLVEYDLNFKYQKSLSTPFYFSDFHYSEGRYIFYTTHLTKGNTNTIFITDADLTIIKSLYPRKINDISLSILAANRIQKTKDGIYYNPAGSGVIDKIDFYGKTNTVLNIGFSYEKINFTKILTLNQKNIHKLIEKMPINKFLVTDNFVLFENYIEKFPNIYFFDRNSKMTNKIARKLQVSNISSFNYVGLFPNAVYGNSYLRILNHKKLKFVEENIESVGLLDHIPKTKNNSEFIIHTYAVE